MIKLFSSFVAFLAISSHIVEALSEIQCEVTELRRWWDSGYSLKPDFEYFYSCDFKQDVVISDPDTKLANSLNENVIQIDNKELPGLQYLPTHIAEAFPEIETIDFHQTSLKALSKKSFYGLFKLNSLSLSHNQIETIEEGTFGDLQEISVIYLDNNKLTSLPPKIFSKLAKLVYLYLSQNQISFLDADMFKNNHKLGLLILDNNKLSNLVPDMFSSQVLMRQIFLDHNELTSLNPEWFKNSPKLIDITFNSNKITEIPLDLLSTLTSLRSISFSDNPLTSFDFKVFDQNTNLMDISLNGINFTRILNIDIVDIYLWKDVWRINFNVEEGSCVKGKYHQGNLNKLKEDVKNNCKTE